MPDLRETSHSTAHVAGELMALEVAEQPEVLARILATADHLREANARIRAVHPRFVLIAARGTSDHAALYAKYLAEVHLQLPAGLASPSAYTVYDSTPDLHDVLFVAVSQSGASPDLVESLQMARQQGALTVAVTNTNGSPLAQAAEVAVDIQAGAERAVAATKTYTAELLTLFLLFGSPQASELAAPVPDAAAATLARTDDARLEQVAAYLQYAERLVVTGRGYSYPSAREGALKLMETSYLSALAFSGADLLHGPLAMIDGSVPVIAITSPGRGGASMAPVLSRVREAGAHLLCVGSEDGLPLAASGVREELMPVLEILPLQRLAWRVALDRNLDPDRPRALAKVTETH